MKYQGATRERMAKGRIVIQERSKKIGGPVGHADVWHSLLDYLMDKGMLGGDRDSRDRYQAGTKLRELWFRFNTTGKDISTLMMASHSTPFVEDATTGADRAEEKWHAVLRALPTKYHATAKYVCIEDIAQEYYQTIDMLDALHGAFYRVEKKQ